MRHAVPSIYKFMFWVSRQAGSYPLSKRVLVWMSTLVTGIVLSQSALAAIEVREFDSVQQEAQYHGLVNEFRCPKCQNQNLAGSDAPIAQDLKNKTYEMVKQGQTDAQIRDYMLQRYGDFISYKPPIRPSTWILWFFPPLVVIIAGLYWYVRLKRQHSVPDTALTPQEQNRLNQILDKNKSS